MKAPSHRNPDTFRELSYPDLVTYANRWARKYSDVPIIKILLYRHSSKYQEYTSPDKRLPYKYAVVFEVPGNVQCTFKQYDGIYLSSGSYSYENHQKLLPHYSEPYEKLVIATQQYSTQRGNKKSDRYPGLIDARFKDVVYLHKPDNRFEDDWSFFTKEPEEQLNPNILTDEPHWILYQFQSSSIDSPDKKSKQTSLSDGSEAFLVLYLYDLERYAKRWAKLFHDVPISKITLYRTFHKHKRQLQKSELYKQLSDERKKVIGASKYAVVFEIDSVDEKQDDSSLTIDDIKSRDTNQQQEYPFYELERKTKEHNNSPNPDSIFFDSDFRSVYFGGPDNENFHSEWLFYALGRDDDLPSIIPKDEPGKELYNICTPVKKRLSFRETEKERFEELNLTRLSDIAEKFCKDFYFLDDVELYVAEKDHKDDLKYVLAFIVNEFYTRWESETKKIFHEWIEHSLFNNGILASLSEVYHGGEKDIEEISKEWLTPIVELGKNINDAVNPDTGIELAWHVDPFEAELSFNLEEVAEEAIKIGYISLGHLYYIMAKDKQYDPRLLLNLWQKYECYVRGTKEPEVDTYKDRYVIWLTLFDRLAFGEVYGWPIERSSPPYLPLCQFNYEEGNLEKYNRKTKSHNPQVKLKDLKNYFTEIIGIPLPALLFPMETKSEPEIIVENVPDKKDAFQNDTDYPDEVVRLIGDLKDEINQLYSCMINNLVSEPEHEDYKNSILECYRIGSYEKVKEDYLEDDYLYYYGEKEILDKRHLPRDFIGKLCQIIISDHLPKRLPDLNKPPRGYAAKRLYENLYKKIKSES